MLNAKLSIGLKPSAAEAFIRPGPSQIRNYNIIQYRSIAQIEPRSSGLRGLEWKRRGYVRLAHIKNFITTMDSLTGVRDDTFIITAFLIGLAVCLRF